jgi:hypothetical protein
MGRPGFAFSPYHMVVKMWGYAQNRWLIADCCTSLLANFLNISEHFRAMILTECYLLIGLAVQVLLTQLKSLQLIRPSEFIRNPEGIRPMQRRVWVNFDTCRLGSDANPKIHHNKVKTQSDIRHQSDAWPGKQLRTMSAAKLCTCNYAGRVNVVLRGVWTSCT